MRWAAGTPKVDTGGEVQGSLEEAALKKTDRGRVCAHVHMGTPLRAINDTQALARGGFGCEWVGWVVLPGPPKGAMGGNPRAKPEGEALRYHLNFPSENLEISQGSESVIGAMPHSVARWPSIWREGGTRRYPEGVWPLPSKRSLSLWRDVSRTPEAPWGSRPLIEAQMGSQAALCGATVGGYVSFVVLSTTEQNPK